MERAFQVQKLNPESKCTLLDFGEEDVSAGLRQLVCGFLGAYNREVYLSYRNTTGFLYRLFRSLSQTPGRIKKVDPLMGVPIKYP